MIVCDFLDRLIIIFVSFIPPCPTILPALRSRVLAIVVQYVTKSGETRSYLHTVTVQGVND